MVLGAALLSLLLPGCGGGSGDEVTDTHAKAPERVRNVNVAMDGWDSPETAGIPMTEERGYFVDSGLGVITLSPVTPELSIPDVVNGSDALGVAHGPEAVMAKDRGAPILIVGSLVSRPTAAMIWIGRSKIDGIADLKGRTIAIPGLSFQKAFLRIVLAQEGLTLGDVKVKKVGNDLVSTLVRGGADAIFGGSWNVEGVELRSRGLAPVATRVGDFGIPAYDELVLIARADLVEKDPDLIRDFTSALARGTAAVFENPGGAAGALEHSVESKPEFRYEETLASVEETLPFLSATGYTSPARTAHLVDWMLEEGLIERDLPTSELLTNEFVAEKP